MTTHFLRLALPLSLLLPACMEPTLIASKETVGNDSAYTGDTAYTADTSYAGDTEDTGTSEYTGDTASEGESDSDTGEPIVSCPQDDIQGWASISGNGLTATTGGGDIDPVRPETFEELNELVTSNSPRVIEISGEFNTGGEYLRFAPDKTLRGIDANAKIIGGVAIYDASNVIIQNLNIQGPGDGNPPGDGISIGNGHHVWIDHCRIWDPGDGVLDITDGSDFITVSWSHFYFTDADRENKTTCLVGSSSTQGATDTGKNNVTWHHNWFGEKLLEAMPRALFGKIHVFNNYYTSKENTYCIGSGSYAGVLIEANYFEGVTDPHRFQDSNPSHITAVNNFYDNDVVGLRDTGANGDAEPFPSPTPYPYTVDAASTVPEIVTRCSGPL